MTLATDCARKLALLIAAIALVAAITGCTFHGSLDLELHVTQVLTPPPPLPPVQP